MSNENRMKYDDIKNENRDTLLSTHINSISWSWSKAKSKERFIQVCEQILVKYPNKLYHRLSRNPKSFKKM